MKALLSKHPYFVALLPIFFVLHGYAAMQEFIAAGGIVQLLLLLLAAAGILYFLFRVLLCSNPSKQVCSLCIAWAFYLFFGALYDFLKAWSPWAFVWKYSVLLITFLVLAIILFLFLRRSKSGMGRVCFFLQSSLPDLHWHRPAKPGQ